MQVQKGNKSFVQKTKVVACDVQIQNGIRTMVCNAAMLPNNTDRAEKNLAAFHRLCPIGCVCIARIKVLPRVRELIGISSGRLRELDSCRSSVIWEKSNISLDRPPACMNHSSDICQFRQKNTRFDAIHREVIADFDGP